VYIEDGAAFVALDGVVVDRTARGFYLDGVDSLVVRNSSIVVTEDEAFYVSGSITGTRAAFVGNMIDALSDSPLYLYDMRSVTSERNVYRVGGAYTGLAIFGRYYPAQPGTRFRSFADSIIAIPRPLVSYDYAFEVEDFDTLVVDSAVVVAPDSGFTLYPGYLYGGSAVRVQNSRFTNISGSPLYLGARTIAVTNSMFATCRIDCSTGYGVYAEEYGDSVALLEVSGNTFDGTYVAVQADYYYGGIHRVLAVGNTIDSVNSGLLLSADSVVLTDNVVTRAGFAGGTAVQVQPRGSRPSVTATLLGNRLEASLGGYALYGQSAHVVSSGNRYAGTTNAMYLYNYSGAGWQLSLDRDTVVADSAQGGYAFQLYGSYAAGSIRRSRLEGGGYGLYAPIAGGSLALDSNVVTASRTYGMYLTAPAGASFTGRWNNVTSNAGSGIYTSGAGTFSFMDGRYVGNRAYGVQAGSGSAVDATNSWWGDPAGPGGGIADSVQGTVATSPFLTTDPAGVSVPPLGPPAGGLMADLWRAPIGSRPLIQAEAATVRPRDDRAERDAWRQARRAEGAARGAERRAEHEQRKTARASARR
jgi:hypothetical protein